MIFITHEQLRVRGVREDIDVETIELLHDLYHGWTKEDLLEMVRLATLSIDELHKEAMEKLERIVKEYEAEDERAKKEFILNNAEKLWKR